jgi:ATP-dependent Clp protease adaptor protein ClpS
MSVTGDAQRRPVVAVDRGPKAGAKATAKSELPFSTPSPPAIAALDWRPRPVDRDRAAAQRPMDPRGGRMSDIDIKPDTKVQPKTERPRLYKVVLINDDYTPREFVVVVLKAVFNMNESRAYSVMMTAHQLGACVVATYTRDVAETKATEAIDMGRRKGHPLMFSTEPEE